MHISARQKNHDQLNLSVREIINCTSVIFTILMRRGAIFVASLLFSPNFALEVMNMRQPCAFREGKNKHCSRGWHSI